MDLLNRNSYVNSYSSIDTYMDIVDSSETHTSIEVEVELGKVSQKMKIFLMGKFKCAGLSSVADVT